MRLAAEPDVRSVIWPKVTVCLYDREFTAIRHRRLYRACASGTRGRDGSAENYSNSVCFPVVGQREVAGEDNAVDLH